MSRRFLHVLALAAALACVPVQAAEHLVVTGGPSLRRWENLRVPRDRHDNWWANFVRASTLRMIELRRAYGPSARIVWVVYRPGYRTRGAEDGKPYVTWISDLARKHNASLVWIDSGNGLIQAINSRPQRSVVTFDYFGHSNRYCFMLDYSNVIMAACAAWVHERDLGRIHGSVFARDAYCKSWGCHTAESMSKVWRRRVGVPLEGAIGSTDYVVVGQGRLPGIVGRWAR